MPDPSSICPHCGQPIPSPDTRQRQLYLWGLTLAWIPALPIVIFLVNALRGISENKATGLGAVAGGISEASVVSGLLFILFCCVGAIVCLARSFSRRHPGRTILSVLSICWSVFVLLLFAVSIALLRSHR
jgi:hypothetical protein